MPESDTADPARWSVLAGIARQVAGDAAALIRAVCGEVVEVGRKSSPTDVVTQTDLDAERFIRTALAEAVPGSGFVGEEGGYAPPEPGAVTWIIDPLDGTVNFTYGIPLVAVAIAAAVDGRVVAGAVVDVFRCEVFAGAIGAGATCDGAPINGSACAELSAAMVTTGFSYRSDLRARQGALIGALLPTVRDIRCFGSAAIEMCWVAQGRVDAYFERDTKLWDYAAASVIASEAGMVVELPCPENDGLAIAAPPKLFEALRQAVD